jgi:hypothetical protein
MRFPVGHTGRPRGTRNKLHRSFIEALQKEFLEHGEGVVRIARIEEPIKFLQIIASMLPKELWIESGVIDDLDDDELERVIARARQQLLAAPKPEPLLVGEEKVEDDKCLTLKPSPSSENLSSS